MREQDVRVRINNFFEVPLGLTEDEAISEATRCLDCKNPLCIKGCPACIDIPSFIREIKNKNYSKALSIIKKTNSLPSVCGRVCPQEDQCEASCVLEKKGCAINIGDLERFVADSCREFNDKKINLDIQKNSIKIAVIGSGPASLSCAYDLAIQGYSVTIFEALHKAGGVLLYGIPEFRLPKNIIEKEIKDIENLGVNIKLNYLIGRTKQIEGLTSEGFRAVFIGTGAGLPRFMKIPGENLNGVYSSNEFLTRTNLMKAYNFPEYDTPINVGNSVCVIGGGNVAVDAARTALRLGAKNVRIIYRRSKSEMPARDMEVEHATQEGIDLVELKTPIRIEGDNEGRVKKLICLNNKLGEIDNSGRRSPFVIKDSFSEYEVDNIVVSIGSSANSLLLDTVQGLKLDSKGYVLADEFGLTNIDYIFAGGDIVTGSATVIDAVGSGKAAAVSIDKYVRSQI